MKLLLSLGILVSIAFSDSFSEWTEKLEKECGRGNASACEALGTHFMMPQGTSNTPRDQAMGTFYLKKAQQIKSNKGKPMTEENHSWLEHMPDDLKEFMGKVYHETVHQNKLYEFEEEMWSMLMKFAENELKMDVSKRENTKE